MLYDDEAERGPALLKYTTRLPGLPAAGAQCVLKESVAMYVRFIVVTAAFVVSSARIAPRMVEAAEAEPASRGSKTRLQVDGPRFTINGKRREMGLGSFPDVGLAEARDKATEHRKQASAGIDPINQPKGV